MDEKRVAIDHVFETNVWPLNQGEDSCLTLLEEPFINSNYSLSVLVKNQVRTENARQTNIYKTNIFASLKKKIILGRETMVYNNFES